MGKRKKGENAGSRTAEPKRGKKRKGKSFKWTSINKRNHDNFGVAERRESNFEGKGEAR